MNQCGTLRRGAVVAVAVLAFQSCAHVDMDAYPREDVIVNPVPSRFNICHGGTCTNVTPVSLDAASWQRIVAVFARPTIDSAEEREQIREAIGLLEQVVGEMTGTADDRAENAPGRGWHLQLDCIDESVNTSNYIKMLIGAGLVRRHRLEARATRGWFLMGWPHTTAVVSETTTGEKWAIDSWFFDNGVKPEVVLLEQWKKGWRPTKP